MSEQIFASFFSMFSSDWLPIGQGSDRQRWCHTSPFFRAPIRIWQHSKQNLMTVGGKSALTTPTQTKWRRQEKFSGVKRVFSSKFFTYQNNMWLFSVNRPIRWLPLPGELCFHLWPIVCWLVGVSRDFPDPWTEDESPTRNEPINFRCRSVFSLL